MRDWIKLVEYMGADLTQDVVSDVFEIVHHYVTTGEGASTRQFAKVYELLPRPDEGMLLHRVLRLYPHQMEQYQRDQSFELRPAEYSSWTKSEESAKLLAQTKGEHVIIVSQMFPAEEIVIDIPVFYNEHELWHLDEYRRYVEAEQEVIVRHITPIQISAANSRAHQHTPVQHPMIGDEAFAFGDENGTEIEDVDHEQPYANRGLYYVTFDGDQSLVRHIGNYGGRNQWECVDHLVHQ